MASNGTECERWSSGSTEECGNRRLQGCGVGRCGLVWVMFFLFLFLFFCCFFSAWSPRWRHARVARLVLWPLLGPNIRLMINRVPLGKGTSVDGVWVTSTWNTMRLPFEDGGATACLGAGSATKGGVFAPRGARGAHSVAPARIRRCGVCKGTRGSVMRRAACWRVGWARFGVFSV